MRRHAVLVLALSLQLAGPAARAAERVYIGTNGSDGVYKAELDEKTGRLSAPTQAIALARAQWLALNPALPVLYAVGATSAGRAANGLVYSLAVDPANGGLKVLNQVDSGGKEPTYLSVEPRSRTLFVANFDSGTVSATLMLADGSLGASVSLQTQTGSGPFAGRQDHAVAHSVAIDATGRHVLVADLGADRVFIYRFDPATRALTPAGSQTLPPGSGPRHLVFDPRGRFVYVLTELTAELHVFAWDARRERLRPVQSLSAYPENAAPVSGSRAAAEVALSRDGRFLYATLRAEQDSIVVYAVAQRTGRLTEIQRLSTGGRSPVSFDIDPTGRWLLVANDASDSITVLGVDPASGRLRSTGQSLPTPKPRAFVFYPNSN